jgi:hypothetical protein
MDSIAILKATGFWERCQMDFHPYNNRSWWRYFGLIRLYLSSIIDIIPFTTTSVPFDCYPIDYNIATTASE